MKLKSLKVIADPILAGKHPYHDNRLIVTSDVEPEVFEDDGEKNWESVAGSIIAKMTDCEHQAEYARLFAAAPELLEALETWVKFWDTMTKGQMGKLVFDVGLMNDGFIQMRAALNKAKGKI